MPLLIKKFFFQSPSLMLFFLPLFCFLITPEHTRAGKMLPAPDSTACASIPPLNKKIKSFVSSTINRKSGNGSCWALAEGALNKAGATWDGGYEFGLLVDTATDCIYPGDIIQFEGVEIRYSKNGSRYEEHMEHHTAIIYKVIGKGNYELAHQNFGRNNKKVILSPLELKNITRGRIFIYRPTQ